MKNIALLLFTTLLISSCGEGETPNSNSKTVAPVNTEGLALEDLKNGYQRAYRLDEKGLLKEEGMMKNGKRNGIWIVYHPRKPAPASVANFVDDQYFGPYLQYAQDGELEISCSYVANQLHGRFFKFKGIKILEEGTYVNGQIEGTYHKFYANNENLEQVIEYKNGKLHGKAKYYNDTGELIMEYEYANGEKIGGGVVDKKDRR